MNEDALEAGDRVRALRISFWDSIKDSDLVPPGTEGTVSYVDGGGGIHVNWDNGTSVALLPGYDSWEAIRTEK